MIIETRGLNKTYRTDVVETTAVDGVNFTLDEGQFVSIMGPSGCGKSTLLHILGMIDMPTDGTYRFLGRIGLSARMVAGVKFARWVICRARGYRPQAGCGKCGGPDRLNPPLPAAGSPRKIARLLHPGQRPARTYPSRRALRQQDCPSSVSSKQAGLLRRGPRAERQLGLVLLRRRVLQVREDLRDHLRLLDAGNDRQLAAAARTGSRYQCRRPA